MGEQNGFYMINLQDGRNGPFRAQITKNDFALSQEQHQVLCLFKTETGPTSGPSYGLTVYVIQK